MLTEFLEAFDKQLTTAEAADQHQKAARKVVSQIESLVATVDALPEELQPTMPTEGEIEQLRAISSTIVTPELQELKAKVESALSLRDTGLVEITDEDAEQASSLVERYSSLMTAVGSKGRSSNGGTGVRALKRPLRFTIDGNVRTSGSGTGSGDWTQARWQIVDHAKEHDGVSREQLDSVLAKIKAYEAASPESAMPVNETIVAGDGTEYTVSYPA